MDNKQVLSRAAHAVLDQIRYSAVHDEDLISRAGIAELERWGLATRLCSFSRITKKGLEYNPEEPLEEEEMEMPPPQRHRPSKKSGRKKTKKRPKPKKREYQYHEPIIFECLLNKGKFFIKDTSRRRQKKSLSPIDNALVEDIIEEMTIKWA